MSERTSQSINFMVETDPLTSKVKHGNGVEKEKGRNTDFETGSLAEGQIAAVLSGDSDMLRSSPVVKGNHGREWIRSDKLRFTSSEISVTDQA